MKATISASKILLVLTLILSGTFASYAPAQTKPQNPPDFKIEKFASRFRIPWSIGFLPDARILVTERAGKLFVVDQNGRRKQVHGTPDVFARGQGGLLDVVVARDFAQSREIFLSYAKPQGNGAGTALAVARLSDDLRRLEDFRPLFEMRPGATGGRHFGSRIVEALDGSLFMTIGERGDRPAAQDLSRHHGSIVRLQRDGTPPKDNPFVSRQAAQGEIWSYGHRNPQGLALDLQGRLWAVEHGAKGGDEVNLIRKGGNYGWPVIAYGRHYNGRKIGTGSHRPGMLQPRFYWDPSIAPSGLMIYSGKLWPDWRGAMFVGSLKFDYIAVLDQSGRREISQLQSSETARVRDIREAPDGTIWFLSEDNGALYRLRPQ